MGRIAACDDDEAMSPPPPSSSSFHLRWMPLAEEGEIKNPSPSILLQDAAAVDDVAVVSTLREEMLDRFAKICSGE